VQIFLIILLCLLVLLGILIFTPIRLFLTFYKKDEDADFKVVLKIGFIERILYPSENEAPKKEEKSEKPSVKDRITSGIELYKMIWEDAKEILLYASKNALKFENLTFHIDYGTGDAASTGILYGVISGIVYGIWGIIGNNAILESYDIDIRPDYYNTLLSLDGKCIVKLRNVHIIIIGFKVIKLLKKMKKQKGM